MAVTKTYTWATGRRKTAVARVRIRDGKGEFLINDRPADEYFHTARERDLIRRPLVALEMTGKLDVWVNAHGGGPMGQAGAVMQGLARALKKYFGPAPASPSAAAEGEAGAPSAAIKKLRDSGLLTRDARMKERKKYGRRGARRSFQFSKR
jgi:small subunit ribosomal protein S9